MRAIATLFACILALLAGESRQAFADKRVALVIGNGAYVNTAPLINPRNDADDIAGAIKRFGFEVIDGRDLDKRGMDLAIARFARVVQDADAAMVFYAGHGLQLDGNNYLMPVDAKLEDEFSVTFEMTRVDDIVGVLGRAKGVKIVVLDACRNNPLAEQMKTRSARFRDVGLTRGLAKLDSARGMVIAYSTQPNQVAEDGRERNSPFTRAFIKELENPQAEIGVLFRRVTAEVSRVTAGRQVPQISDSLIGEFYFSPGESDQQHFARIRDSRDPAVFREFLGKHGTSPLADFVRNRLAALDRESTDQIERERRAKEAAERERLAKEAADRERLAKEAAERLRLERERQAKEAAEKERLERERIVREAAERAERERLAKEAAERERLAREYAEQVRLQQELAERARREREAFLKQMEERERQAREAAERLRQQLEALKPGATPPVVPTGPTPLPADIGRTTPAVVPLTPPPATGGGNPQIATLPPPNLLTLPNLPKAPETVTPALTGDALVIAIKKELARVGCYSGALDARWGNGPTSRAVAEFAKLAALSAVPLAPEAGFLDTLKSKPDRVCPLVCARGQTVVGGICVAVARPPAVRPKAVVEPEERPAPRPIIRPARPKPAVQPRAVERPAPARPRPVATRPKETGGGGGGGRCFAFNGQRFCE